jgi:hypothetical protein
LIRALVAAKPFPWSVEHAAVLMEKVSVLRCPATRLAFSWTIGLVHKADASKGSAGQRGRGLDKRSLGQMKWLVSSQRIMSAAFSSAADWLFSSAPALCPSPHQNPAKPCTLRFSLTGEHFVWPPQSDSSPRSKRSNTTHNILPAQTKHQRQGTIHVLLVLRPTPIKS